jgi:hypothetical protein
VSNFLKTPKSVQKKSACNSNYLHKLHVQPFPIYKMPVYSKKQKHVQYQKLQCFHSGLFLFGFDSMICNPFSMVWAILFLGSSGFVGLLRVLHDRAGSLKSRVSLPLLVSPSLSQSLISLFWVIEKSETMGQEGEEREKKRREEKK